MTRALVYGNNLLYWYLLIAIESILVHNTIKCTWVKTWLRYFTHNKIDTILDHLKQQQQQQQQQQQRKDRYFIHDVYIYTI